METAKWRHTKWRQPNGDNTKRRQYKMETHTKWRHAKWRWTIGDRQLETDNWRRTIGDGQLEPNTNYTMKKLRVKLKILRTFF